MCLEEQEHCFLIKDFFEPGIIAGFTKPAFKEIRSLPFVNQDCKISFMRQTHSNKVCSDALEGANEADGIFTKNKNHLLIVKTADCLPLVLSSQKLDTVGVVHGGWRSLKGGILDNIPYNLENFSVFLGVGLRKCCYEVGRESLDHRSIKDFIRPRQDKLYFDPIELTKQSFKKTIISDSNICSFCSGDEFFSFRRNKAFGRTLSFILRI